MRAEGSVWFAGLMALAASACVDAQRDAPARAGPASDVQDAPPGQSSRRDGDGIWLQQQKLLAIDGDDAEYFGTAVAMSANTVLVGSTLDDAVGSAQVFERSAGLWGSPVKLLASGGADGDMFGVAVSIDGDTALIGASGDATHGDSAGAAYIFVRSGGLWSQQAELQPNDPDAEARFGASVWLAGGTALIGAPGDATVGAESGSAYVFVGSAGTWTQQAKLQPADMAAGRQFGASLALSADTALIGADAALVQSTDPGAAYVFTRTGTQWTQQQRLTPLAATANVLFGDSVAIAGDTALIGAPNDEELGEGAGSAYVYS